MNRNLQCGYVRGISVFFALMLMGFLPRLMADTGNGKSADVANASKQHVAEEYGNVPLAFEANTGQTGDQVKFLSRGPGYTLFLTRDAEAVLMLGAEDTKVIPGQKAEGLTAGVKFQSKSASRSVFRMKLANADITSQAEGLEELPGKANYFIGSDPKKWRSNVPLFSRVQYRNVYPGVDLVYYGNQRQLEYDFIVAPGADPRSVVLSFAGIDKLSLDDQDALVLRGNDRQVQFAKPRIYQQIDGERREIEGGYVLKNAHQVGFRVAAYDVSKPLVIDPTLSYSTYLGAYIGYGVAVDAGGNAYMTGPGCSATFPRRERSSRKAAPLWPS